MRIDHKVLCVTIAYYTNIIYHGHGMAERPNNKLLCWLHTQSEACWFFRFKTFSKTEYRPVRNVIKKQEATQIGFTGRQLTTEI